MEMILSVITGIMALALYAANTDRKKLKKNCNILYAENWQLRNRLDHNDIDNSDI